MRHHSISSSSFSEIMILLLACFLDLVRKFIDLMSISSPLSPSSTPGAKSSKSGQSRGGGLFGGRDMFTDFGGFSGFGSGFGAGFGSDFGNVSS